MLKPLDLTASYFTFLALVVGTVELIDNEMLDHLDLLEFLLLLRRRVAMNNGFKVAGIIMDDRIGIDLRQLHGCLHHLHFVRQRHPLTMCSLAARIKRLCGSMTNCHPAVGFFIVILCFPLSAQAQARSS